jgi:hypothetical protein
MELLRRSARVVVVALVTLLSMGCASSSVSSGAVGAPSAASRAHDPIRALHRLYQLGESLALRGDHVGAVALWRQTFLLLPSGPEADALRSKLVVRMSRGVLMAYQGTQNPAYLDWGRQVLERYLAKLDELHGDHGIHGRSELFELLGELEAKLEAVETTESARSRDAGQSELADAAKAGGGPVDDARSTSIDGEAAPDDRDMATDIDSAFDNLHEHENTHRGEPVDPRGMSRSVVVRDRGRLARLDDPRVQRHLRHPSPLGQTLFESDYGRYHATRVLVRRGVSRALDPDSSHEERRAARRRAADAVRAARDKLATCYEEALSRKPQLVTRIAFELTFATDGSLDGVSIAEGHLVDAVGDACAMWAFMGVQLEPVAEAMSSEVQVEVPLTVFLQPERGPYVAPRIHYSQQPGMGPGDTLFEYDLGRLYEMGRGIDVKAAPDQRYLSR